MAHSLHMAQQHQLYEMGHAIPAILQPPLWWRHRHPSLHAQRQRRLIAASSADSRSQPRGTTTRDQPEEELLLVRALAHGCRSRMHHLHTGSILLAQQATLAPQPMHGWCDASAPNHTGAREPAAGSAGQLEWSAAAAAAGRAGAAAAAGAPRRQRLGELGTLWLLEPSRAFVFAAAGAPQRV